MGRLRNMATVYLMYQDKVLLLYKENSRVVHNAWVGSAGGHFEECELNDARACVLRELEEELSLTESDIQDLSLKYVCQRYVNGEIRINYYYFATLQEYQEDIPSNEGITAWYPLEEVLELTMPYTAKSMLEHYLQTGRYTDRIYGGIAGDECFTFTEFKQF